MPTLKLAQGDRSGREHQELRGLRNRCRVAVVPEAVAVGVGLVVVGYARAVVGLIEFAV